MIILIFGVTRTVQLFSRVPGTTGSWFFGMAFWIGFGIQLFYYQVNVQSSGQFDAIPDRLFVYAIIGWLILHAVCRSHNRSKGMRCHSFSPGLGIFYRWLPNTPEHRIGLISDMATAALLGALGYFFGCPILGSWYLSMTIWLLMAQGCLHARDRYRTQRMDDARIETDAWTRQLQEQRQWVEQQKERWGDRY